MIFTSLVLSGFRGLFVFLFEEYKTEGLQLLFLSSHLR